MNILILLVSLIIVLRSCQTMTKTQVLSNETIKAVSSMQDTLQEVLDKTNNEELLEEYKKELQKSNTMTEEEMEKVTNQVNALVNTVISLNQVFLSWGEQNGLITKERIQ